MLEVRNISYAYPRQSALFCSLSFSVGSQERIALQAPSGYGKTTLCQLLAGYLKPAKGSILCDGMPLPKNTKSPVQMMWQHPEKALDPHISLKASLEEAGDIDPQLCCRLGIKHHWLTRYPHELSGGQLQRISIARALATKPRYLIADEISTMLDAITQAQLWEFLLQELVSQDIGLAFVSHSPALTTRIATKVIELNHY